MSKLTLKGISNCQSSSPEALTDLNLEIKDKELLVLSGPTGSGKTVLLRMIAGLEDASKGDILLGEKRINEMPAGEREVALVSPETALFEDQSVSENLSFGLKLRKVPKAEMERRVKESVSILGLEPLLDEKISGLSAADRQRTALGRAIVRQPKVFLLDAPFSKLTSALQSQLRAELIRIHERLQATILYATADPMEALAMGNSVAAVKGGAIQQLDTPANLYSMPANLFVAGFFGVPPMNLIHGSLKRVSDGMQFREQGEGSIECKLGDLSHVPALGEYVGKEVVLGVRPEQIRPILEGESSAKASMTRIKGLADLIEPRGAETLIHFQTGAHSLTSRSNCFLDRSEAGHRMQFELDLSKACFFDPASGLRVYPK